jgi:hypothetical protein
MMRFCRDSLTADFVRILAISQIVAFALVIVPNSWIAWLHARLGLGEMPDEVIFGYLLRGAAWCQGAFGIIFWVMATDVVRYRPLIITTAGLYLAAAPSFLFLDSIVGLPWWWSLWDFGVCSTAGAILLALCVRPFRIDDIDMDRGLYRWASLIWPMLGVALAFVVAILPSKPGITLLAGVAALCIVAVLVLIFSASRIGARLAALLAGLFLAVPCFVEASPFARLVLVCFLALPLAASIAFLLRPPIAGVQQRMAYLCTWCGTRSVQFVSRYIRTEAIVRFALATLMFGAAIAVIQTTRGTNAWLVVRWLAGGIAILAVTEMITACQDAISAMIGVTAPALFESPHRSTSLSEFWAQRWNPLASAVFHKAFFRPLAQWSAAFAMVAVFAISAVGHGLLTLFALGRTQIALVCAAFFLLQPMFIAVERKLKVRRWSSTAGWLWTVAVLAITSPLFVEPLLQIVEKSWPESNSVLLPTAIASGSALVLTGFASLACLSAVNRPCVSFSE